MMTDQLGLQRRLGRRPDDGAIAVGHHHDIADSPRSTRAATVGPNQPALTTSARVSTVKSAPSASRQAAATSGPAPASVYTWRARAHRPVPAYAGLQFGARRSKSTGPSATCTIPWSAVTISAAPAGSRSAISRMVRSICSSSSAHDSTPAHARARSGPDRRGRRRRGCGHRPPSATDHPVHQIPGGKRGTEVPATQRSPGQARSGLIHRRHLGHHHTVGGRPFERRRLVG